MRSLKGRRCAAARRRRTSEVCGLEDVDRAAGEIGNPYGARVRVAVALDSDVDRMLADVREQHTGTYNARARRVQVYVVHVSEPARCDQVTIQLTGQVRR